MAGKHTFLFALVLVSIICTIAFAADLNNFTRRPEKGAVPPFIVNCDDGLACTDDSMVNGKCTHTLKPGFCLIGGACYARGQANPKNPCQECRDDWGPTYRNTWGYDNSNTCSDLNNCTYNDRCHSGACIGTQDPSCKQ